MGVLDYPNHVLFYWFIKESLKEKIQFKTDLKKILTIQSAFWLGYILVLKKRRIWLPITLIPLGSFIVYFNCLKREIIESYSREEFELKLLD